MQIKKLSKRALFVCLAAMVFMLGGCEYIYPKQEESFNPPALIEPEEVTYKTFECVLTDIESTVKSNATFKSEDYQTISLGQNGGYVQSIQKRLGNQVEKGDILMEFENKEQTQSVRRQEINVAKAEISLKDAEASKNKNLINIARWDLELARIDLENANEAYENTVIRAPMDGKVSWMLDNLAVGNYIAGRTAIMRIDSTTDVILEVSSGFASDFTLGQKVTVVYKYRDYTGEVVMTPASAPDSIPVEQRTFTRIKLDEGQDIAPNLGESATAIAVLEHHENVIVLPKSLLKSYVSRTYVQVLEDGVPMERDVETGIVTATHVEIVNGLNEGDLVIQR